MKVTEAPSAINGYILRYASNGKFVMLTHIHTFVVNDKEIIVPAYFTTDLTSVPRICFSRLLNSLMVKFNIAYNALKESFSRLLNSLMVKLTTNFSSATNRFSRLLNSLMVKYCG